MDMQEHIKYWVVSAEHDLETAETLYTAGKYDWCLFITHIVIEKILKAAYVLSHNNDIPPKIHNLVRLAELSAITFTKEELLFLDQINDFNLETRYPDYKLSFYKTCTREYTSEYFNKSKELYLWIKSRII